MVYIEGRHVIAMTPERYMGAWRSVNDLRVQLGPEKFDTFLDFIENRIMGAKGNRGYPFNACVVGTAFELMEKAPTFSTKAGTLASLRGMLRTARIAPMHVSQWQNGKINGWIAWRR